MEFTYLGDRVNAGGGCEAAVGARTKCEWAKPRKSGELLHGRRFPQKLKGAVHRSYIRPTILYGSAVNPTKDRKVDCESNMWSTAHTERDLRI